MMSVEEARPQPARVMTPDIFAPSIAARELVTVSHGAAEAARRIGAPLTTAVTERENP